MQQLAYGVGARTRRLAAMGVLVLAVAALTGSTGLAEACSPDTYAIGTMRTLAVDPETLPRVGTTQYPETIPLRDHEVVLTFDDGPSPATTGKVLDALAAACVKATFFAVGAHVVQAPALVRRAAREGHTIGTHTQTHPVLPNLAPADAAAEIAQGIDAAAAALGPDNSPAPFFRAPYLATTPQIDDYLRARNLMLWGIDIDSEDWRGDSPENVLARIFKGLDRLHKGIILMHDVQPYTAQALPTLLQELKARGYKVVHVVPQSLSAAALTAR